MNSPGDRINMGYDPDIVSDFCVDPKRSLLSGVPRATDDEKAW